MPCTLQGLGEDAHKTCVLKGSKVPHCTEIKKGMHPKISVNLSLSFSGRLKLSSAKPWLWPEQVTLPRQPEGQHRRHWQQPVTSISAHLAPGILPACVQGYGAHAQLYSFK